MLARHTAPKVIMGFAGAGARPAAITRGTHPFLRWRSRELRSEKLTLGQLARCALRARRRRSEN